MTNKNTRKFDSAFDDEYWSSLDRITRSQLRENRYDILGAILRNLDIHMNKAVDELNKFGLEHIEPRDIGPETHRTQISISIVNMANFCDSALVFTKVDGNLCIEAI